MKSVKIFLLSALLVPPQAFAGTKSTEGLSRQVSALRNALQSWRGIVDAELSALRTNIEDLVADADRAHTCAASQMLYDGTSCVALPVQTVSPSSTPNPSSPTQPTQVVTSQDSACTASAELCDIYQDVLGREPDRGGALHYQGVMGRLQSQQGMSASAAAAEVRRRIQASNEAQGRAQTTQEVANYHAHAQRHQISNASASCSGSTSCNTTATANAVEQAYIEILGRRPDAGGAAHYGNHLESGNISLEQFRESLRNSDEAKRRNN